MGGKRDKENGRGFYEEKGVSAARKTRKPTKKVKAERKKGFTVCIGGKGSRNISNSTVK